MSKSQRLIPAAKLPDLSFSLVDGGSWQLAANPPGFMLLLEVYRGYHCPRCRLHLEALNDAKADFDTAKMDIIAVSMDTAEKAKTTRSEWGIKDLKLGYGLKLADAEKLGLFISQSIREGESDIFAEPGVFFIQPDLTLYGAVIGTFPFVRPAVADLLEVGMIVAERGYPPRGTLPPLDLAS